MKKQYLWAIIALLSAMSVYSIDYQIVLPESPFPGEEINIIYRFYNFPLVSEEPITLNIENSYNLHLINYSYEGVENVSAQKTKTGSIIHMISNSYESKFIFKFNTSSKEEVYPLYSKITILDQTSDNQSNISTKFECYTNETETCFDNTLITKNICSNGKKIPYQKCRIKECDTDKIVICWDSSQKIEQSCINYSYVDTGNRCSPPECVKPYSKKCENGKTIVLRECVNYRYVETGNNCESKPLLGVFYLFAIILGIVVLFLTHKNKKEGVEIDAATNKEGKDTTSPKNNETK